MVTPPGPVDRTTAHEKAQECLDLAAASADQPRVAQAVATIATHWLALESTLPMAPPDSGAYL